MKLQVLHGSFGRILAAAVAIAFMFSLASPAQAQQGQWGRDGCFYAPSQRGQWVRQGCVLSSGGSRYYPGTIGSPVRLHLCNSLAAGTRMAGNNWPGSGYAVVGGTSPSVTGNAQVDAANNRMYTNHLNTWTAPTNITYVPAR